MKILGLVKFEEEKGISVDESKITIFIRSTDKGEVETYQKIELEKDFLQMGIINQEYLTKEEYLLEMKQMPLTTKKTYYASPEEIKKYQDKPKTY